MRASEYPDAVHADLATTLDLFKLLGDPTRVRLLALVRQQELTVAELVRATGLPQPRVSTHLRRLREAGLVVDRREGSSAFYGMPDSGWPEQVQAAWRPLQDVQDEVLQSDARRLRQVLEARSNDTTSWADAVAGRMARHYSPGRTWQSLGRGLAGLCRLGRVLDVASGDGALAELLAPRADTILCLDLSEAVVVSGRRRLAHLPNVRFERGDMHDIPVGDDSVDHLLLMAALCYATDPHRVLCEARRVLAPDGDLVLVDLCAHPHEDVVADYGHVQRGFEPAQLRRWLQDAGFEVDLCAPTGRERRPPHFEILTAYARTPSA